MNLTPILSPTLQILGICRVLCVLLLLLSSNGQCAIDAYEFDGKIDERRFRDLISELRCPKCQNQSLSDSNAPLAQDLRARVYTMIKDGRKDSDITQYLVARYGDFIMYKPPLKPVTWFLWFSPVLVFIMFVFIVVWRIRKRASAALAPIDEQENQRLQSLLQQSSRGDL